MKRLWILLPLALLLSACEFSLAADVTPPPGYQAPPVVATTAEATSGPMFPLVPPDPAKGATIFAEKCAPCHGVSGMGDGPNAANLPNPVTALGNPDVARQATPARWYDVVTNGNLERFMPPFKSLSDRERWDVVAYALSLSIEAADPARAAELYGDECAACHGPAGAGDGPKAASMTVPVLSDQERMASKTAKDFFTVITNGGGQMPAFADKLSEADRWALADYTRTLTFAGAGRQVGAAPGGLGAAGQDTPLAPGATAEAAATAPLTATEAVSATLPIGIVSGAVTTADGKPAPGGLTVNLHAFQGMDLAYTSTTTLKADGTYTFEGLEMPQGIAYLTTVDYDGVLYGSEVVTAEDASKPVELPIQIFETTTDASVLLVDRLHYFFEPVDDQTMRVLELFIISNPTDKTVMAAKKGDPVLTFKLPQGATNLQFQDGQLGQRYVETPGGFGDTIAVRPGAGNYQVLFSYELPYNRKLELTTTTPLITQAVVILAPEDALTVKGDGLEDAGSRDMQGVQYHMYNAPAMGPGGELKLTVSGRSRVLGLTSASSTNLLIGLGALAATLLVAGVWLFQRSRQADRVGDDGETPLAAPASSLDTSEAVMDAILALDDLYNEGKLPEDAYLQRRGELKARLQDLLKN